MLPFLYSTTKEDTSSGGVNQLNFSKNSNSPESVEENPTSDSSDDKQLRQSQRQHKKPQYLEDYVSLATNAESFVEDLP